MSQQPLTHDPCDPSNNGDPCDPLTHDPPTHSLPWRKLLQTYSTPDKRWNMIHMYLWYQGWVSRWSENAKMWKLALTRAFDPNRPTRRGVDPVRFTNVFNVDRGHSGTIGKLGKTNQLPPLAAGNTGMTWLPDGEKNWRYDYTFRQNVLRTWQRDRHTPHNDIGRVRLHSIVRQNCCSYVMFKSSRVVF